jgi:hypothetical protein
MDFWSHKEGGVSSRLYFAIAQKANILNSPSTRRTHHDASAIAIAIAIVRAAIA